MLTGKQSKPDSDEVIVIAGNETPTQQHDNNNSDSQPHPRTPSMALVNFDGDVDLVRAQRVRVICFSKSCVTFSMHATALFVATILGLVMMILNQGDTAAFALWSGLFGFGIGGFTPNPRIKSEGGRNVVTRNGQAATAIP